MRKILTLCLLFFGVSLTLITLAHAHHTPPLIQNQLTDQNEAQQSTRCQDVCHRHQACHHSHRTALFVQIKHRTQTKLTTVTTRVHAVTRTRRHLDHSTRSTRFRSHQTATRNHRFKRTNKAHRHRHRPGHACPCCSHKSSTRHVASTRVRLWLEGQRLAFKYRTKVTDSDSDDPDGHPTSTRHSNSNTKFTQVHKTDFG